MSVKWMEYRQKIFKIFSFHVNRIRMANRKIKKGLQAKSTKKSRSKIKSWHRDVAVDLPKPVTSSNDTDVGVMEDNCSVGATNSLSASLPVLGKQVGPVSKEDIVSAEQNSTQEHSLLPSNFLLSDKNVLPPIKPGQHITEKANKVSDDILPFHLESAVDQEVAMLEYCKENIPCGQQTTHLSDNIEFQRIIKKETDCGLDQQMSVTDSLAKTTKTDIALEGYISASFKLINNEKEPIENSSPVLQQHFSNLRPKTPNMPIPVTEMFSPNTVNEFRTTLRNCFPNGPPPPKPIIPMKKRKKGDTPYIVGCAKRRRVPEKKTLSVFKGDKKYGVTEETNSYDDEECPLKRKRGKRNQSLNWSKSRFNPKSEEIAARLKMNENVDEMLRKSPSKETISFMSKPYASRPQSFSPLPSTSKDSETIMKNEKHFSESLNYKSNNFDIFDDDELPEIHWESEKNYKKTHKSLLRSKDIEIISEDAPSIKNEDMNNNNDIMTHEEVDFYEIQFDKYKPKKEYTVPTTTTSAYPIVIDDDYTNGDLEKVIEVDEPKRDVSEIKEVFDTVEIKDDYSSITYEDLYSVPKSSEVVDLDALYKELQDYKQKSKNISQDIITIVDPADLEASHNRETTVNPFSTQVSYNEKDPVNLVPEQVSHEQKAVNNLGSTHKSLLKNKTNSTTIETAEVIDIPVFVEPVDELLDEASTNGTNKPYSWNDVEFVSEIIGEQTNKTNDIETVVNGFFNEHRRDTSYADHEPYLSDVANNLQMLFSFVTESCSRYMQPKQRRKKSKKSQSPNKQKEQYNEQQQSAAVGNENAAPSTNGQVTTSPTNGERRLGDCPICMENLTTKAIASTTCGHVFCLDCIKKCLRTSGKKCPTCRKTLKGAGYHQVFL